MVGTTGSTAAAEESTTQAPSATSATILSATTQPDVRDSSMACRPSVTTSAALRGKRTGMPSAASDRSLTAGRVVADEEYGAAAGVDAVHVGVAQGVRGAIDAGALAVPEAGDAVVRAGAQRQLDLAAPHRRRGELLVETGDEADVVLIEDVAHVAEHLVEAPERAALVAGHEGRRTQASAAVERAVLDEQARDRLDAGQQDRRGAVAVAVIEVVGRAKLGSGFGSGPVGGDGHRLALLARGVLRDEHEAHVGPVTTPDVRCGDDPQLLLASTASRRNRVDASVSVC